MPRFPLKPYPACRNCYRNPPAPAIAAAAENLGRPFFFCDHCNIFKAANPAALAQRNPGWITWHDAIGVQAGNPICHCGMWSRLCQAGPGSNIGAGRGFWTCPVGKCLYWSARKDGRMLGEIGGDGGGFMVAAVKSPAGL